MNGSSYSASFFDEGFDIFDLTLDRVLQRVPTIASTPSVIVDHCEVQSQELLIFQAFFRNLAKRFEEDPGKHCVVAKGL